MSYMESSGLHNFSEMTEALNQVNTGAGAAADARLVAPIDPIRQGSASGSTVGPSPLMHTNNGVTRRTNCTNIAEPLFMFGGQGSDDGQFEKPWGICCDKEGCIYVADRDNHRIQVFEADGTFKFKFGQRGHNFGEFYKPSSVAVDDKLYRIVVADKDNNRLQVFHKFTVCLLMVIGEKGYKRGQFDRPYDVAINSKSQILVSDSDNHRLQIFSSEGICHYVFTLRDAPPIHNWKEIFDEPRGVCFNNNDDIICTDFNNHRAVVIKSTLDYVYYFGSKGQQRGELMRPQGICVDQDNNIIIAESRNNRIQIFSPQGAAITSLVIPGSHADPPLPSGICVSPNGIIFVVDVGYNRVVAYQNLIS